MKLKQEKRYRIVNAHGIHARPKFFKNLEDADNYRVILEDQWCEMLLIEEVTVYVEDKEEKLNVLILKRKNKGLNR